LSPLLVQDVQGWRVYAAIALIGVSEGVSAVATQALLGQETPPALRGSVMGAATVIGMLGAIGVNFVGGFLFDAVNFVAPFVMVGVINLLCLAVCLLPGKQSFRRAVQG
jgi:MFS family permease